MTTVPVEIVGWPTRFVGGDGATRRLFEEPLPDGATVRSVLRGLTARFPELEAALWHGPDLGEHIEVVVNGAILGVRHTLDSELHDGDRILLTRRTIQPGRGLWTFPGGFVDHGETATDAAIRETFEEIGLVITADGLTHIGSLRYHCPLRDDYVGRSTAAVEARMRLWDLTAERAPVASRGEWRPRMAAFASATLGAVSPGPRKLEFTRDGGDAWHPVETDFDGPEEEIASLAWGDASTLLVGTTQGTVQAIEFHDEGPPRRRWSAKAGGEAIGRLVRDDGRVWAGADSLWRLDLESGRVDSHVDVRTMDAGRSALVVSASVCHGRLLVSGLSRGEDRWTFLAQWERDEDGDAYERAAVFPLESLLIVAALGKVLGIFRLLGSVVKEVFLLLRLFWDSFKLGSVAVVALRSLAQFVRPSS